MKLETFAIALLVLLAAFYAGWYLYDNYGEQLDKGLQVISEPVSSTEKEAVRATPPDLHPLPARHPVALPEKQLEGVDDSPTEPPFPDNLEQSDSYLQQRVSTLIENKTLRSLLLLNHFIPKLVVTIDNLMEAQIPRQHLPLKPPKPGFLTFGSGDEQLISKANAKRYTPYVELFQAIPDAILLHLYRGLYPLFQQAYRQTGSRSDHFNDRLIKVMDHLLNTPEPENLIKVTRHIHRFKFSDPGLESRSAGQKMLLRCGTENMRRVKQKLRTLRQGLTGS